MDCFQATKLRRITKRRFNELAIQARERLPLDLIPPRWSRYPFFRCNTPYYVVGRPFPSSYELHPGATLSNFSTRLGRTKAGPGATPDDYVMAAEFRRIEKG